MATQACDVAEALAGAHFVDDGWGAWNDVWGAWNPIGGVWNSICGDLERRSGAWGVGEGLERRFGDPLSERWPERVFSTRSGGPRTTFGEPGIAFGEPGTPFGKPWNGVHEPGTLGKPKTTLWEPRWKG